MVKENVLKICIFTFLFNKAFISPLSNLESILEFLGENETNYSERRMFRRHIRNNGKLIRSLDWKVPNNQLTYNLVDKTIKNIGNLVYYINYKLILSY